MPEPVTRLDSDRFETSHGWPHFLPDGRRFVYLARRSKLLLVRGFRHVAAAKSSGKIAGALNILGVLGRKVWLMCELDLGGPKRDRPVAADAPQRENVIGELRELPPVPTAETVIR
jgi:hypothetical protein